MKLELLAISDTHLGESSSLLTYGEGKDHLRDVLVKQFGESGAEKFNVDEVILMGDIADRTLSSTDQIKYHTKVFMDILGSVANITERVVYIPGNHDHTMWTEYWTKSHGPAGMYGITPPGGELIIKQGNPTGGSPAAKDLLELFFGSPPGSSLGAFDFVMANPLYARILNDRPYVFTHGTHFRWDVTMPQELKVLLHKSQLVKKVAHLNIDPGEEPTGDESMDTLEQKVSPFVDSLWPSAGDNPTPPMDELWYLYVHLRGNLERKPRPTPASSQIFWETDFADPKNTTLTGRINKIADRDRASLDRFRDHFCRPMLGRLIEYHLPSDNVTFVYGDTHRGGWENSFGAGGIRGLRIYNTGAWVVEKKNDHPSCHIFGVSGGKEFLFDVSFQGVQSQKKDILQVAWGEAEHRKQNLINRSVTNTDLKHFMSFVSKDLKKEDEGK